MKGEFHTKSKRRDMNALIRGHHFRFGTTDASFETTHGSSYTAPQSESPSPLRSRVSSSVYLGTDPWDANTISKSDYKQQREFPKRSDQASKTEHNKHHFSLGLHSADVSPPSHPQLTDLSPVKMCRPPLKTAIVLGTDEGPRVSTTKGDYRRYNAGTEVVESLKGRFEKVYLHLGTERRTYETTSSAIGKQRGTRAGLCEEAQRTYLRMGNEKAKNKRSLSQEHYSPQMLQPVEDTSDRSTFVRSSHFALGTESPELLPKPREKTASPGLVGRLPDLKKTSVELGREAQDLASSYATHFQPVVKGDRAVVNPWTGCSVGFGALSVPQMSVYGANYQQHSLADNCLTNSLDLQKHNFQIGHRKEASYDTTAGEIGKDTRGTFRPNTSFTSFSKQKHFSFGNSQDCSFDTTTKTDYTFKGGSDRVRIVIPQGVRTSSNCDYRTVHQSVFKWVQPVPSI